MTLKQVLFASAAALAIAAMVPPAPASAQQAAAVAIDTDDIGGVVMGPNGPEAGVWVIAETADLPTRFIKSVVTDDQGRYLIPDLPKANYDVFARGYGLLDTAKVKSEPGKIVNFTASTATPKAAAEIYPAIYWYAMLQDAGAARIPARQREEPGGMAQRDQDQRLLRLSRARQQGDPHHSGDVLRHEAGRRLGAPHPVRPGDEQHGDRDRPCRRPARVEGFRRAGPTGSPPANCPPRKPQAAAGPRAQCRHHAVGFLRSQALPPRHHVDRQAQADHQRERPDLRRGREFDRPHPGARPGQPPGLHVQDAGARSEDARHTRTIRCRRRPTGATR